MDIAEADKEGTRVTDKEEQGGGKRRVVALVQARLGSARLPGKMLLPLRGLPLIDWVLRRIGQSALLDAVVLATSTDSRDDALANHVGALGIPVFRGPEHDVLERFRQAGLWAGASHVVRVCADNPLIWGGEIDRLVERYFALAVEKTCGASGQTAAESDLALPPKSCAPDVLPDTLYVYNHIPRNNLYPDGLGAEMISSALLEELAARAVIPAHREHCFSFIWDNTQLFSIHTFDPQDPALHRPDIRLDIDTEEDYQRMCSLPVEPDSTPRDVVKAYDAVLGKPHA